MKTKLHGISILVIDDDLALLRALGKVLTAEGALVTSVCGSGEAMEHLTNQLERYDLIITDLRMPFIGGRMIVGAATVALPDVPVIVITAFGNPELKAECLQAGAAAFLEKPLDTQDLLAAIHRVLLPGQSGSARRSSHAGAGHKSP